jgi:hypothetical protein
MLITGGGYVDDDVAVEVGGLGGRGCLGSHDGAWAWGAGLVERGGRAGGQVQMYGGTW